jgi:hypothetical protein
MTEKLQIGKMIRTRLKADGRTVVWLATQINCDRSKLQRLFNSPYIDCELLMKISVALNHDFFNEFTRLYTQKLQDKTEEE